MPVYQSQRVLELLRYLGVPDTMHVTRLVLTLDAEEEPHLELEFEENSPLGGVRLQEKAFRLVEESEPPAPTMERFFDAAEAIVGSFGGPWYSANFRKLGPIVRLKARKVEPSAFEEVTRESLLEGGFITPEEARAIELELTPTCQCGNPIDDCKPLSCNRPGNAGR